MSDFCPVCQTALPDNAPCPVCGFDPSTDAEAHATLSKMDPSGYRTRRERYEKHTDLIFDARLQPLHRELQEMKNSIDALRRAPAPMSEKQLDELLSSRMEPLLQENRKLREDVATLKEQCAALRKITDALDRKSTAQFNLLQAELSKPRETAPAPRPVHTLRASDFTAEYVLGNRDLPRSSVKEVYFLPSVSNAPKTAWDVSEEGNGSVLAWMENGTLCFGAEGGIRLNPDSGALFRKYTNVKKIQFGPHTDTSAVTDMRSMFFECSSLEEVDLSHFDTAKVTDMHGMFGRCFSLARLDVHSFDTSGVTDMGGMFITCFSLKALDLGHFRTDSVTDMSLMFFGCRSLKSLDLSGFRTTPATKLDQIFERCACTVTTSDERLRSMLK